MTNRSQPSPLSPVAFARDYQRYRSEATRVPYADTRLLLAARFWSARSLALSDPSYESYSKEDLPPILTRVPATSWADMRPSELCEIADFIEMLPAGLAGDAHARPVWEEAARQWLYLGEARQALDALMRTKAFDIAGSTEAELILDRTQFDNAADLPSVLANASESTHPVLARWLRNFETGCQAIRESGDSRKANCLLVEYDSTGKPTRGRLRTLDGRIEALKSDAEADEVIFGHQVRAADDPQVLGVYAALVALRRKDGSYYRGHFAFVGSGAETFGGDSLGLASFAIAYGDRWGSELHRERKLIGSSVAFTGAVDADGAVRQVSTESLAVKIERAFRSPLEYVAVPEANRRDAEAAVGRLREQYPLRRLRIIGVERTEDILTDHNILRPEKVCIGEFAVRTAARYSRSVKVQVPVLAVLAYLLFCLLFPKAWLWFDWTPSYVLASATGISVQNRTGYELWSREYTCPNDDSTSQHLIGDLDADGMKEVIYFFASPKSEACSLNASVFVYDEQGREMFRQCAVILGEYPGDTTLAQSYTAANVDILTAGDRSVLLTIVTRSFPARSHIRFWNASGSPLGWYINAGFAQPPERRVVLEERALVCILGYNNPVDRSSALFALSLDSSYGCSPPYAEIDSTFGAVVPGNQIAYLVFPRTDLSLALLQTYSAPMALEEERPGVLRAEVLEKADPAAGVFYYVDSDFRVREVRADDYFFRERDKLVAAGVLPPIEESQYLHNLLQTVRYWSDSGWVTEEELRVFERTRGDFHK